MTGEIKSNPEVAEGGIASLRAQIREAVTEASSLKHVQQLIDNVFSTTKATLVTCPECGVQFKAPLPDVKVQVDSLIDLLEQAEGKAETKPQEATTVIIERPPR
jgi:hypothetical protein